MSWHVPEGAIIAANTDPFDAASSLHTFILTTVNIIYNTAFSYSNLYCNIIDILFLLAYATSLVDTILSFDRVLQQN